MKKSILFFALVFLIKTTAFSQVSFGASFGTNLSTLSGNASVELSDFRANAYCNLLIKYEANEKINFNLDVTHARRGYMQNTFIARYNFFRLIYLDLNPNLEYKIANWLGVGIGIYGSLKLREGIKDDLAEPGAPYEYKNNTKIFNRFDLGFNPFLRTYFGDFYLHLTYQYGLTDIVNQYFVDFNNESIGSLIGRNRNLSLGFGYRFN